MASFFASTTACNTWTSTSTATTTGNLYFVGNQVITIPAGMVLYMDAGTACASAYNNCTNTAQLMSDYASAYNQPQPSAEERAETERLTQERQQAYRDAERLRKAAQERAQALLLEHLTPEQRETVEKHKWFVVHGGKSKHQYRIGTQQVAGNVREFDDKGDVASYCCHCDYTIPHSDQHLAQKLMLEYHEDEFLRLANKTALRQAA